MSRRRGVVLLTVLWVVTGLVLLGITVALAARESVAGARNRAAWSRAAWHAEGCLEAARAVMVMVLSDRFQPGGQAAVIQNLDRRVLSHPLLIGCEMSVVPVGVALDVNAVDGDALRGLFRAAAIPPRTADSLADAILDWRDADDVPRPLGAEASWYRARGLPTPRNGPLASQQELDHVRGFAGRGLATLLNVEPGRVALNHAPGPVLASLPGVGEELLGIIASRRIQGVQVADLGELAGHLSPPARDLFSRRYAEMVTQAVVTPDAWLVRARATDGVPPLTVVAEDRLLVTGAQVAVIRRRSWVE